MCVCAYLCVYVHTAVPVPYTCSVFLFVFQDNAVNCNCLLKKFRCALVVQVRSTAGCFVGPVNGTGDGSFILL